MKPVRIAAAALLVLVACSGLLHAAAQAWPAELDQATRWKVSNESALAADLKARMLHAKSTPPPGRIVVEVQFSLWKVSLDTKLQTLTHTGW